MALDVRSSVSRDGRIAPESTFRRGEPDRAGDEVVALALQDEAAITGVLIDVEVLIQGRAVPEPATVSPTPAP